MKKDPCQNFRAVVNSSEWESELNSFAERTESLAKDIRDRMAVLQKEMSNIDLEISDLHHYIELSNLDAFRGYNAYKMLKERLVKRRAIKNEYEYLYMIIESNGMKSSQSWRNKLSKRGYEPRKIKELFDG